MKANTGWVGTVVFLALGACLVPPPDDATKVSTGSTSTGPEPLPIPQSDTSSGAAGGETSDTGGGSGETNASESSGAAGGQPIGFYPCTADDQCASGHCFDLGILKGICSECGSDADCAAITGFGCSPPDAAAKPLPAPAFCHGGELGGGCETSAACGRDLTCEHILDVQVVFDYWSCSACATHTDCADGRLCSPTITPHTVGAYLSCLAPGSVKIGGSCDVFGDGDAVCASGNCAEASIDGLATIGLCSECDDDGDCPEGEICMAADVDTFYTEFVPGVCDEAK